MFYHHIVAAMSLLIQSSGAPSYVAQGIDTNQRALEFRAFVNAEVLPNRGAIELSTQRISTKESLKSVAYDYRDGWIGVAKDNGQIYSFYLSNYDQTPDPSWAEIEEISDANLIALCQKFYRAAGFSEKLKLVRREERGSDGLPDGSQRFWRVSAAKLFGAVRTSRGVVVDFDIDADSRQLRAMVIDRGPILPPTLQPLISEDEALSTAMNPYLSECPDIELSLVGSCDLCIWDPRNYLKREFPETPADVREAMNVGRGLLVYEMAISDVRGTDVGSGPAAYAVIDARNGRILYAGKLSPGLGGVRAGGSANARRWGRGPFALLQGKGLTKVKNGWVSAVRAPESASTGRVITVRSGDVYFQARYHPETGLLSRNTSLGTLYAKPNAALLKAIRDSIRC